MKFLRLVRHDIEVGVLWNWKCYALAGVLGILFTLSFFFSLDEARCLTWGECLVGFGFGMKRYVFIPENPFELPVSWLLLLLLCAYGTLRSPSLDFSHGGKIMLVLSGNRVLWWLSKCLWICASVMIFFAVFLLSAYASFLFEGGENSLFVSGNFLQMLGLREARVISDLIAPALFLIPLVVIAICLWQMLLALILKPVFAFAMTVSLLFFSAFFEIPVLIGNFAMLARSFSLVEDGLSIELGYVVAGIAMVVPMVIGSFTIRQRDLIKEESE